MNIWFILGFLAVNLLFDSLLYDRPAERWPPIHAVYCDYNTDLFSSSKYWIAIRSSCTKRTGKTVSFLVFLQEYEQHEKRQSLLINGKSISKTVKHSVVRFRNLS